MRVAVVGVGAMGRNHVRVYNEIDDVELVGVADGDADRRADIARRFRLPAFATAEELFDRARPDAVSVAVPTVHHVAVAAAAIRRGIHVLIEKPLAPTVEVALELTALAERHGVCLAVGHVERHNAAIVELRRRLDAGEAGAVYQIHAQRLSPFPQHVLDVGVVMDLATHDIDLMRHLLGDEVDYVFADVGRRIHPTHEDSLCAILRFGGGVTGVLDINWLTPTKVREMRVTGSRGMFVVDYLTQDLSFTENSYTPLAWDTLSLLRGVEEGNTTKIRIARVEPLRAELLDFLGAIRDRRPARVTGLDGARAVELAQALLASGAARTIVRPTLAAPNRESPAASPASGG